MPQILFPDEIFWTSNIGTTQASYFPSILETNFIHLFQWYLLYNIVGVILENFRFPVAFWVRRFFFECGNFNLFRIAGFFFHWVVGVVDMEFGCAVVLIWGGKFHWGFWSFFLRTSRTVDLFSFFGTSFSIVLIDQLLTWLWENLFDWTHVFLLENKEAFWLLDQVEKAVFDGNLSNFLIQVFKSDKLKNFC